MEKRSAPLRSGSIFFGDLAAVNLKVDRFSFVSSFHTIPTKGHRNTFSGLIKTLLAARGQILRSSEGKSQISRCRCFDFIVKYYC